MSQPDSVHPSVGSPVKRAVDLTAAALGLVLLAPVFAIVALAVLLSAGRPALFRQVRPGYRGELFTIYKFRTMREACGADGEPLPDAERVTGLGRLLRKTSLDELPQLWNVLCGELSLVGPRPQLARHLFRCTCEQSRRHEVRPGITGWAQINGRNRLSWEERFRHDVWYVDHWSHRLDGKILLLTILKVVRCEGNEEGGMMLKTSTGCSVVENV
jgi:lipopolysaccharide/colanic/teichoic acid biosynthesis glycosyltransferase